VNYPRRIQAVLDAAGNWVLPPSGAYPRCTSYTYASGRIKYWCHNADIDAAKETADWLITKFTDASGVPEIEGPRIGRVDSEANIDTDHSWNI